MIQAFLNQGLAAADLGLIFGIMALGVYITFRILNFPDLTVDGSFTTGAAVAASAILGGVNPWVATLLGLVAGAAAGLITGLLHTKGKINPLLAGILTQIALYSINLRIMGRANLPLLRSDTTLSDVRDAGLFGTWASVGIFLAVVIVVLLIVDWFLSTDTGLAMQATGDNEAMIRAQGVSTDTMKILGLVISNALVGLAGAIMAQYQGYADIGMGIGLIVAGLASVIIGQAVLPSRHFAVATAAVVLGSVIYREVIQLALSVGFNPNDMKLISAVLVVLALLLPRLTIVRRMSARRRERQMAKASGHPVDTNEPSNEQLATGRR
ncbi:MAG: ABC transporter permease [Propionibacteriaceae bacterium]|nr:ABC transporter permease [Propionibacteriaceae bacterium]